jgi:type VII secretion protein EccB
MRSRRDQVQAYRFITRRIVSALLSGEPETNELPMRRLSLAMFGSVMVAAIILGGVGAFGLLTNRRAPLENETIVIERETGAKYVFVEDRLYPVLNYASARLVLNKPDATVRTMSQASLRGYARGLPIGIPNAPDALPEPSALVGHPWQVCITAGTKFQEPSSHVVIGRELPGAQALGSAGLLVSHGEAWYLLWNDRRLLIPDAATLAGLGLSAADALPVTAELINAIKAGPDLRIVPVPDDGQPSSRQLGGQMARIGDIYRVSGQHYLLTVKGLAPVGEVTVRLRLSMGSALHEISAQAAADNASSEQVEPEGFPQQMPSLHPARNANSTICAVYRSGAETTSVELHPDTPDALDSPTGGIQARPTGQDPFRTVDHVIIEGGKGALVQASSPDGGLLSGATVYLITERGVKYPLDVATGDARSSLGYADSRPTAVPKSLLDLIPTGPLLSTRAARQVVEISGSNDAPQGSLAHYSPPSSPTGQY